MSASFDPSAAASLVEILVRRAELHPDRLVFAMLTDGEASTQNEWTYAELDRRARAIAILLRENVRESDRVVLLYPTSLEFIAAFFGCLYAGVVAVPAYPPRSVTGLARIRNLANDADTRVVLTTSAFGPLLEADGASPLRFIATDEVPMERGEGWEPPRIGSDTIALLQYTSGSTSEPKGVVISHRQLVHNETMISAAFGHGEETRVASWLPLYHDMGLIGCMLNPVFVGGRCWFMDPLRFVQRPFRWLRAISTLGITTAGAPNFAYDLCVERITHAQRETLDLRNWTVAFCGAEPIRRATLNRFAEAFAGCGFRKEALYPCYGLAEATLFVSGGISGEGPRSIHVSSEALSSGRVELAGQADERGLTLVDCGRTWLGQEIVIADPDTGAICPAGRVGEIWIAGPSVALGYRNQPEATAERFGARLFGSMQGPYLRTGDLGFVHEGRLFVTGRLKDLMIIDGRNHYPQDIERTAQASHQRLRPGAGAAFMIEGEYGAELVIVQEIDFVTDHEAEEAVRAIRGAVAAHHEVPVRTVVLLASGASLKTTSGKIRRAACRDAFINGTLRMRGC